MLRLKFLNASIISVALAFTAYAQTPKAWQPIKILGATYPKDAQFAGIEGVVEAKCSIRDDGSVAAVDILSGHLLLGRAVKSNLSKWRFQVNKHNKLGEQIVMKYKFQLRGYCDNHKGCAQEFWFDYPDQVTVISERPHANTSRSQVR